MTYREIINRELKLWWTGSAVGALILILGGLLDIADYLHSWVIQLIGVGLLLISAYFLFRKVICPKCKKPVGDPLTPGQRFPSSVDPEIKHCPYCGVNIDEEVAP